MRLERKHRRRTANEQLEAFVHETKRLALHFVQVFLDRVGDLREHGEQSLRHARGQLADVFNARLWRENTPKLATERSFMVNTVAICSFVSVDAISTRESASHRVRDVFSDRLPRITESR